MRKNSGDFGKKSLKLRGQGDHREALPVVNVIKLFSHSGKTKLERLHFQPSLTFNSETRADQAEAKVFW